MANGIGKLDFALGRQAGGDHVLCHVAAHVGGAAIDFRRVLARKCPAAVPAHPAVGIDDNLAAGEAGIALRAADDKAAGRVDQELRLRREQILRQHFPNDLLDAEFLDLRVRHAFGVLGRDDDVGDRDGLAVLVNDRDLALGVRAQPFHLAALADAREFAAQTVREHDRRRHELRRLVARIAKHQALIARALLGVLLAIGLPGIHALRDVGRLGGDVVVDENFVGVKDIVGVRVADAPDRAADNCLVIELRLRRDLAADDHDVALHERLARHAAVLVLRQAGVEDRIGDGVAHFVRMTFTDGL